MKEAHRAGLSTFAAALSLASAWGLSLVLRRVEARRSHALPIAEVWFDPGIRPSTAAVAKGKSLYLQNCAHCHAADATGDEGPDLHELQVSDRYISNTVSRGIKGEMPSFRKKLTAEDIRGLSAYLRSLE